MIVGVGVDDAVDLGVQYRIDGPRAAAAAGAAAGAAAVAAGAPTAGAAAAPSDSGAAAATGVEGADPGLRDGVDSGGQADAQKSGGGCHHERATAAKRPGTRPGAAGTGGSGAALPGRAFFHAAKASGGSYAEAMKQLKLSLRKPGDRPGTGIPGARGNPGC